jgi:two-component system, cell cycle response regulator
MSVEKVKYKYLAAMFVLLLVGVGFRLFYDINHHQHMLHEKVTELESDIKHKFLDSLDELKSKYLAISYHYANDQNVYNSIKNIERENLHSLMLSDYECFQSLDKNLHVMHFFDTKNITILRMHQVENYGDDLTNIREIVNYTNITKVPNFGFEIGKNGITYRVTIPLITLEKEHFATLEFGIEPHYLVEKLAERFDLKSYVFLKKEGFANLIEKKEYESFDDYNVLITDSLYDQIKSKIDFSKNNQIIQLDKKTYMIINSLNLESFKAKAVGKVVVIKDITDFKDENFHSLVQINMITIIISLVAFVIIYFILVLYSKEIKLHLREIDELDKKSKYFEDKSNIDELTKLYNRRFFNICLDKFLEDKNRGCIIFFDIDHFKQINDQHGHSVGDMILSSISKELKLCCREDDVGVRWGGEEFALLLKNMSFERAVKKAEDFRKRVEKINFENNIKITISLGVTQIREDDTSNTLIQRVDQLLYSAKNSGRNCVKSSL